MIRVGLLFGGVSGEHEVSLMSARSILNAISREKYEVVQIGITHEGQWVSGEHALQQMEKGQTGGLHKVFMFPVPDRGRLYRLNGGTFESPIELDVLFPVLHGTYGEDGNMQGYMELMDIPYVGANVASSAVCMEKGIFKDIMRAQGIPVVETLIATRGEIETHIDAVINRCEAGLIYPVFVKPVNLGSSVGVNKCHDRAELVKGLTDAAQYSVQVAIEQGVNAREIEVSILGDEKEILVSCPGEISYQDEFYSYQAKYFDDRTQLIVPAAIPPAQAEEIRLLGRQAFQAVGCSGMARVDFLLDKTTGKVFVSELNTIPGFTHASMYPRLWDYSGIPYSELIDRLIELAMQRHEERKRTKFRFDRSDVT